MKEDLKKLINNTIASSSLLSHKFCFLIYEMYGIKTNKSFVLLEYFFSSNNVSIGQGSFVKHQCFFDKSELIEIG